MIMKLEMHDIQDKGVLLDRLNEMVATINKLEKVISAVEQEVVEHLQGHQVAQSTVSEKPKPKGKAKK